MKQLRMLYVEDNDELRETFQEMLEDDQREVVACATAEEALVLWDASHFDVLVSDISLPGMSGTDLARRMVCEWGMSEPWPGASSPSTPSAGSCCARVTSTATPCVRWARACGSWPSRSNSMTWTA